MFCFGCFPLMGKAIRKWGVFFFMTYIVIPHLVLFAFAGVTQVALITSGSNIDAETGKDFFEPFVRRSRIQPWALYAPFFIWYVVFVISGLMVTRQRSMISTIVSQWYFSRTKEWLKSCQLIKIGYQSIGMHMGTYAAHTLFIMFFYPIRIPLGACKYCVN